MYCNPTTSTTGTNKQHHSSTCLGRGFATFVVLVFGRVSRLSFCQEHAHPLFRYMYVRTCIRKHTYIRTYIHKHIHTYTHTHLYSQQNTKPNESLNYIQKSDCKCPINPCKSVTLVLLTLCDPCYHAGALLIFHGEYLLSRRTATQHLCSLPSSRI